MPIRTASARWQGNLTEGSGTVRTGKGGLTGNYSFKSRFEEGAGTNPEELIAAANAGCFTMALTLMLGNEGHTPEELHTDARAVLRNVDGVPTITGMELKLRGKVPGVDDETFQRLAEQAKKECVISRALAGIDEFTLEATLESS